VYSQGVHGSVRLRQLADSDSPSYDVRQQVVSTLCALSSWGNHVVWFDGSATEHCQGLYGLDDRPDGSPVSAGIRSDITISWRVVSEHHPYRRRLGVCCSDAFLRHVRAAFLFRNGCAMADPSGRSAGWGTWCLCLTPPRLQKSGKAIASSYDACQVVGTLCALSSWGNHVIWVGVARFRSRFLLAG
jgi:hypothetical protein